MKQKEDEYEFLSWAGLKENCEFTSWKNLFWNKLLLSEDLAISKENWEEDGFIFTVEAFSSFFDTRSSPASAIW